MSINWIIYDFDGVLTDNCVVVHQDGSEAVRCNRSDGLAIALLRERGIPQFILSTEANPVVRARAGKLRIPVLQNSENKRKDLISLASSENLDVKELLFVGNDLNDIEAMLLAGFRACPSDAAREVLGLPDIIITKCKGGEGVVRELYSLLFHNSI